MSIKKSFLSSPGRTVLISIVATIFIGTFLLALPAAQVLSHSFIDLLFTATSATCVTGLLTIQLTEFTTFGHVIILALMQIGGLGLITLTVFFMSLFVELGLGTQLMAGQVLEIENWKRSKKIIGFIIGLTLTMELVGTVLIFFTAGAQGSIQHSLFLAFFHAVSSFCSAGFTLFPGKMLLFKTNILFLGITTILMLVGELGFITWHEIILYIKSLKHRRHFNLSLHSKLVLSITGFLVTFSACIIWLLERTHGFSSMTGVQTFANVLFNTISYRSTGFTTLDITTIHLATFFLIMVIAFIGSSPGSTGSGIKTTTFAIFLATVRAVVMGRTVVEIKGRRIPNDQVFKAMAILSLSISWVAITTFCLLITEEGWRFVDIMFEAFSAFSNLGLSTGLTPDLSLPGKIIIIATMIIGRIGSLTVILAFKRHYEKTEFHYPEERVMMS